MGRILALLAATALVAAGAVATAEELPADESGSPVLETDPAEPRDFGGAVDSAGGAYADRHTVDTGDTLWDISEKYLGNPWYWPKIWSYNPGIENPHWIYPGDEIRLAPDGDYGEERPDLADVSRGTLDHPGYGEDDDVTVAGPIGYQGKTILRARTDGFLTERELAESGVISASPEEKEHLLEGDRIYVRWDDRENLQVGENYVLYRTRGEVRHPTTGHSVGYMTQILGHAEVISARPEDEYVVAVIRRSYQEILRGDLLGPAGIRPARRVVEKPNSVYRVGTIVASFQDDATQWGQWDLVFVDLGRRDGIEEGNTFDVVRWGDGLDYDGYSPPRDAGFPKERVGRLVVVDVKEEAAAAMVMWAVHELHPGDRVAMYAAE